jgi:cation diffusion facilitator family transporter
MTQNRSEDMDKEERQRLAERGTKLSLIAYIIISTLKLTSGLMVNSKALIADGINNATDIFVSIAILVGLKISKIPADDNHPYGHLRSESIASLVASVVMIAVGLNVSYTGIRSMFEKPETAPHILASIVGFLSSVFIFGVYLYNKKLAKKIESEGLLAAAKDNLTDSFVSSSSSIGIIAAHFGFLWLDPLIAVLVGFMIIRTGYGIFKDACTTLSDGCEKQEIDDISTIVKDIIGVKSVNNVKARKHGNEWLMDIIIGVDSKLTIDEGHRITEEVERELKENYEIADIIIHVEPDHLAKKQNKVLEPKKA